MIKAPFLEQALYLYSLGSKRKFKKKETENLLGLLFLKHNQPKRILMLGRYILGWWCFQHKFSEDLLLLFSIHLEMLLFFLKNVYCLSESESSSVMSDSANPWAIYSPCNSPGHNTGVGSFSLLQEIFPTQGSNPGLLHCRQILYQLSHKGSPLSSYPHHYSNGEKNIKHTDSIVGIGNISSVQFSSVSQSCLTLCDPMDCSTPGFSVHHQLPELPQTHVHRVSDATQPSHSLSSLSPPAFNLAQHQSVFQ